jgi:hypothetical protein
MKVAMKKFFYLSLLLLSITSNTETNPLSMRLTILASKFRIALSGPTLAQQLRRNSLVKEAAEAREQLLQINGLPKDSTVQFVSGTNTEARRWPITSTMTPQEKGVAATIGFIKIPDLERALGETIDNPWAQQQLDKIPTVMHSKIN